MTTPAENLYQAKNAYVADQVERHGSCQATREEAWERIDQLDKTVKAAVALAGLEMPDDAVEDCAYNILHMVLADYGERDLASAMISAEVAS